LEKDGLKDRDLEAYNQVWEGLCRQSVDGAIFGKELQQAELDGRITRVPYDPTKPVHAIFDLGWADSTSIWFLQFVGMETRLIRYLEDSQKTITHYMATMQTFGYVYDTIWLPHDAGNQTLAAAGRSIGDIVRNAGFKTHILPRVPIIDSINAGRSIFPTCYFDRDNAADGINCLRHYRFEVDPATGQFGKTPLHDHYSHGADAFRMIGLMITKPKDRQSKPEISVAANWMD
jgi:phage terminase large subunit